MSSRTMLIISALFLFTSPLIVTSEPVLDTDGHPIRAGEKYYVVPPKPGAGGGLTLATNKGRCPYEIVQIVSEPANGLPVIFSPSHKEDKEIEVDNDINVRFIDFNHITKCPESKVWKIDAASNQQQQGALLVTVGGSQGNPGPDTLTNWFKIEKTNDNGKSYKFQYCPRADLCNKRCRPLCGDIGVVIYDGRKRLAVNELPLGVVFKKAHV